ncbi:hypothetical protein WJ08_12900 [Burkholderia vietnamiensis]|nr:hypothetical protein WJ08_12900 [Burkholderia vietnamiensis]KVF40268.1 hypothetical protein WJ10_18790 [Burkholderia vietnamiensis]
MYVFELAHANGALLLIFRRPRESRILKIAFENKQLAPLLQSRARLNQRAEGFACLDDNRRFRQASANLYSLVESAKANGVEPYRYLVLLFTRLPLAATADDYAALMPWSMPAAPNL